MKLSAQEAGALLRRRAQALDREVLAAERDALSYAVKTAEKLSSGTLTTAALRAMGHPYRIGGSPPQNPAIINAQTATVRGGSLGAGGAFRTSWQTEGPRKQGGGLVSKLTNASPYARYLLSGTGRMIMRPILDAIRSRVSDFRYRKLQEAARKALSGS